MPSLKEVVLGKGKRPGDEFETLLQPQLEHLMRVAYRITDDTHRAEDLVQDVLVKLYPRRKELRQIDKLRPWLARVMYRQYVDDIRRYARSPVKLLGDDETTEGDPYSAYSGREPAPDAVLEQDEELARVQQVWSELNDDQRTVLGLHDVEGYTLQELVDILDTPLGTLKSRLHRARVRLRELLQQIAEY